VCGLESGLEIPQESVTTGMRSNMTDAQPSVTEETLESFVVAPMTGDRKTNKTPAGGVSYSLLFRQEHADAVVGMEEPVPMNNRKKIVELAGKYRLPQR
jgi:hypothetical protein